MEIKDYQTFKIVLIKNLYLLTTIVFSFGFTSTTYAQNPVTWEFKTQKINDSTAYLIIEATIADGWKLYGYAPHLETPDDEIPTITIGGANYEDRCNPNLGLTCLEFNFDE